MKDELQNELFKKYPKMFLNEAGEKLIWGFECGDGWFDLIDELCSTIQNYIDNNNQVQVTVSQVKEKFGTLRFYCANDNRLVQGMIWFAEAMSERICETCGAKGKLITKGWHYVACDQHLREGDKE